MVKAPRILYVCSDEGIDLLGTRGCSTHLREMCSAFKSLGCDIRLLHANDQGQREQPFDIDYEMVAPFRSKKLGYDLRKVLTNHRLLRRLRALVEEFKPDIIYERYDLYSTAAARIASVKGFPYLLEVNAPLIEEQRNVLHFPRLAGVYQGYTFGRADLLIGVSDEMCSMLKSIVPRGQVLLVENGVNDKLFNPNVSGAEVRKRYGLKDTLLVGFVGSLKGWQGIKTLIRAASILLAERNDLRFLVAGGGNNLPIYGEMVDEAQISDAFTFVGPVPDLDIPGYIAAFDICVAPYNPMERFYFSPIKLREYISMRKAIVASDMPPIRKTLRHDVDGLLAAPGDARDLAAKLARLLDDAALRERLARSAHDRFNGKLSWQNCAQRILEAALGLPEG